jgi:hypothetical protein
VLVRNNTAHLIRRRETLEDIYRNEVEIIEAGEAPAVPFNETESDVKPDVSA